MQSADALVEHGILQSRDAAGPQAFVKDDKAYFIANAIRPGNERAVFLHEVGAAVPRATRTGASCKRPAAAEAVA